MFSVIIPVHNKFPHLSRSINSVLNQTFRDFELLLIDDASTDGSEEKVKEFKDPRIRLFRRDIPGPGGYAARNLGINEAKFEWISFLDADDEWHENYLEKVYETIQNKKNAKFIVSNYTINYGEKTFEVKSKNKVTEDIQKFTLIDYLKNHNIVWTGVVNIKKELLSETGLFPIGRCKRGGDIDTWIRCLYESSNNYRINSNLAVYYKDTVNRVTDNKTNPTSKLCSFETLQQIKSKTTEKELLRAIDAFYSRYLFNHFISINKIDKIKINWLTFFSNKLKLRMSFFAYKVYKQFK